MHRSYPGPEWIPIGHDLPKEGIPVLVLRPASYNCCEYEVLTGRYQPTFRPKAPWRDISGDAITDSGYGVMAWKAAPEWLFPKG